MADGCPSLTLVVGNILCRSCSITTFHVLDVRMVGKEVATLLQGNGMRMHLTQGSPVVLRQATNAMLYMQFILPYHRCARLSEQVIVVEQRPCDGVLYCQHGYNRRITLYTFEHLLEGVTANQLYLLALIILVGCDVVERPYLSLYCNSLHLLFLSNIYLKKIPLSLCVCEAGHILCFYVLSFYIRPCASQFSAK